MAGDEPGHQVERHHEKRVQERLTRVQQCQRKHDDHGGEIRGDELSRPHELGGYLGTWLHGGCRRDGGVCGGVLDHRRHE